MLITKVKRNITGLTEIKNTVRLKFLITPTLKSNLTNKLEGFFLPCEMINWGFFRRKILNAITANKSLLKFFNFKFDRNGPQSGQYRPHLNNYHFVLQSALTAILQDSPRHGPHLLEYMLIGFQSVKMFYHH
jgi:hypothetical protein